MAREGGECPQEIRYGPATPTNNTNKTTPLVHRVNTSARLSDGSTATVVFTRSDASGGMRAVVSTAPPAVAGASASREVAKGATKVAIAAVIAAGNVFADTALAGVSECAAGGQIAGGCNTPSGVVSFGASALPTHIQQNPVTHTAGRRRQRRKRHRSGKGKAAVRLAELEKLYREQQPSDPGESDSETEAELRERSAAAGTLLRDEGNGGSGSEAGSVRRWSDYTPRKKVARPLLRAVRRVRVLQQKLQQRVHARAVRVKAGVARSDAASVKRVASEGGDVVENNLDSAHASPLERSRYYSTVDDELSEVEPEPITCTPADMDKIHEALTVMADQAEENGLKPVHVSRLREILHERADAFRLTLAADPPAKVQPIKYRMADGAKPWRSPSRSYTEHQKRFLEAFVDRLLRFGYIYKNPNSPWASGVHLVRKAGVDPDADILDQYRLTVDLRGPNSATWQSQWPLPRLDDVQEKLVGSRVYAKLDMKSAYWMLPVHKDSQELHTFRTHNGTYTPTRLSQGSCDGAQQYQYAMQEILGELYGNGVLSYLDDVLVYAETEEELMDLLEKVIERMHMAGMKMSAAKCSFFSILCSCVGTCLVLKARHTALSVCKR